MESDLFFYRKLAPGRLIAVTLMDIKIKTPKIRGFFYYYSFGINTGSALA
jgi:hypothetical protein